MELRHIGIVGAGTIGRGLAELCALTGFTCVLVDRTEEDIEAARRAIELSLHHRLEKWALTEAEIDAALSRIRLVHHPDRLAEVDFVLEAITEDLDAKKNLFRLLDQICDKRVVFASNTSTLSITEIASVTYRPDRILGLHFLSPVTETRVVEIVRALKTSDQTVQRARELLGELGKTGVEVFESPGYITTRLTLILINEAMYALMEGVSTASGIDTAMKLGFDMPRGPLEIADRIGLDTLLVLMERLRHDYGDRYRPCPLLGKLVRARHLGAKTGEGFFRYDGEGNLIKEENPG